MSCACSIPWHVGPPENGFKPWERHSDQRLLGGLGLTLGHVQQYRTLFLDDRLQGKHSIYDDEGWPMLPYRWNDHLILRHLAGLKMVGLFWNENVRTLMLDFDAHDPRTPDKAYKLAADVVRAMPGEWTLYQSSDTGGVRGVAFLDRIIPRETVQKYLLAHVREAGFKPENGILEARMDQKPDRLPFGVWSVLIDPINLEPMFGLSLAETIEWLTELRNTCYIEADEIVEWSRHNSDSCSPEDDNRYHEWLPRLLKEGLFEGTGTYLAMRYLNFYLRARQGMSESEAVAFLKQWIRKNHNGNSKRINAGRLDSVDQQIEETGRRFVEAKVKSGIRKGGSKSAKPPPLNRTEFRALLEYDLNFKELQAAWNLLPYCKAKLRSGRLKKSNTYVSRLYGKQGSPNYVARNSWGNWAPIPWKLRRALPGFGAANPKPVMDRLVWVGLFQQKRECYAASHICREFWVPFPFTDDDSGPVTSPETAILEALGEDGVRQRFSPHYARKIIEKARKSTSAGDKEASRDDTQTESGRVLI